MHARVLIAVALFAIGVCGQSARAAPETYEYFGWIIDVKVLDSSVPLPPLFSGDPRQRPAYVGTLVVDAALPPEQRLLYLSAAEGTAELMEVAAGHPDNRVVSQRTSDLGIGVPPPHWEIVTISGSTGPVPGHGGRTVGMSLQWHGEPGAARQYPNDAQDVDLGTLTPRTSWRMNFTLRDGSVVYATASANVVAVKRRGTGGPDYEESFGDGLAQGWTPRGGTWSASTGDLRNASNTAFTSNISGITLPDEYVLLTDVYLSWGASGNTAGVLFNYHGPGDFLELRLNAQGSAWFSSVRGGVRQTSGPVSYPDSGIRRWHTIYVTRAAPRGAALQIEVNGQRVFEAEFDPEEPDLTVGGSAGVFASWNLARFDNVLIGAPIAGPFGGTNRFNDAGSSPTFFRPQSGVWTIANGYMRSSANQAVSIAVCEAHPQIDRAGAFYGVTGRVELEWSGAGNWGGLLYDYVDAQNFREVRVSRTVQGRVGEIVLAQTVNGVRREVLRTRRFQSAVGAEVVLSVRREGDRTIVHDGSAFSNIQVRQAPVTAPFTVGLLAAWNLVRFDDVLVDMLADQ